MSLVSFEELPDRARVWVFPADRSPSPSEAARMLDRLSSFLEEWTAHSSELHAALDWRHHRFLLVGVDEERMKASGCSIDALMRELRSLEQDLDITLTDYAPVWFLDDEDRIRCVSRERFGELAREREVDEATTVFDPTLESVSELRQGGLGRAARASWHRRMLTEEAGEPSSRDRAETGAS